MSKKLEDSEKERYRKEFRDKFKEIFKEKFRERVEKGEVMPFT
jgi:hypothetical protein